MTPRVATVTAEVADVLTAVAAITTPVAKISIEVSLVLTPLAKIPAALPGRVIMPDLSRVLPQLAAILPDVMVVAAKLAGVAMNLTPVGAKLVCFAMCQARVRVAETLCAYEVRTSNEQGRRNGSHSEMAHGFSQRRYRALAASGVRCMYDGRTLADVKRDPDDISRRQVFPVDRSRREFVSSVDVTAIIRDASP